MSDVTWLNEDWRSLTGNPRSKRTAALGEEVEGSPARVIPSDFDFDEKNLKPLSRVLWSLSVAMAHLLDAYDKFSKIKSAKVSPDGLLGGHGYVRPIAEIRQQISAAQELVSSLVDTIHDEVNGPHWTAELANLPPADAVQIEEMVSDVENMTSSPGEKVEEHYQQEVVEDSKTGATELPTDESDQTFEDLTTGQPRVSRVTANSTNLHNLENLGGPRVNNRGPGEGEGPYGSFNTDEQPAPPGEQFRFLMQDEGLYPSENSGDYSSIYAEDHTWRSSSLPGYDEPDLVATDEPRMPVRKLTATYGQTDPDTRRDVDDFGMGYGARGDGEEDSSNELLWFDSTLGDM